MRRNTILLLAMLLLFSVLTSNVHSEQAGSNKITLETALAKYNAAIKANSQESWQESTKTAKELAKSSTNFLTRSAAYQLYLNSCTECSTPICEVLNIIGDTKKAKSRDFEDHWFNAVDITEDSSRLLLLDCDTVRVLNTADMSEVAASKPSYDASSGACFSKDGSKIYFAQASAIAVLDAKACKQIGVMRGYTGDSSKLKLSPDGKYLIAVSRWSDDIFMFDLATEQFLYKLPNHSYLMRDIAISPDSKYIYHEGDSRAMELREIATNKLIREFEKGHEGAFSQDGKLFCNGSAILDVQTLQVTSELKLPENFSPSNVAFSSDNSKAFLFRTCECLTFSTKTGMLENTLVLRDMKYIDEVIPAYGTDMLVACDSDGSHSILSASTGEYLGILSADDSKYHNTISPDGRFLLTAEREGFRAIYLPAFRKPISSALSTALKKGDPNYTNLLASAIDAHTNGNIDWALKLAEKGAIEVFKRGNKLGIAAAVDLLRALTKLSGKDVSALSSETIESLSAISTDKQPVIGIGFRDNSIAYATRKQIKFTPPLIRGMDTFEIDVPEGKEVLFSNHCVTTVAPKEMGSNVVFRGCHDGEFPFAEKHKITDVAYSQRGMEAVVFTPEGFFFSEFWLGNICAVFHISGANAANTQYYSGTIASGLANAITFYKTKGSTKDRAPNKVSNAFFAIPNPFSTDLTAIHCDTEWHLLAACSSAGEVGIWDVNFGYWRGEKPDNSKKEKTYDPEKGKVPLHTFKTSISSPTSIRWFFKDHNARIVVLNEKTGEFAIHSYPSGSLLHKGKTLPGKVYSKPAYEPYNKRTGNSTHEPSPEFFIIRGEKSFGVVNVFTSKSEIFDGDETISSLQISPIGDVLVYGTASGYVKFLYLPALFVR